MSDRFARLNHGYAGDASCDEFAAAASGDEDFQRPDECFLGSSDAQAAASVSNFVSNSLTFLTASMVGSLSDEYGRKGKFLPREVGMDIILDYVLACMSVCLP